MPDLATDPSVATGPRIDVRSDIDAAYWCRVFDVDRRKLCDAIQHVGPQVSAVRRYLSRPDTPRWVEDSGF
jgi:hypothetical protein